MFGRLFNRKQPVRPGFLAVVARSAGSERATPVFASTQQEREPVDLGGLPSERVSRRRGVR